MKEIIKLLFTLVTFIALTACSCHKKLIKTDMEYGTSMKYALVINDAKIQQVDSLILADTLPSLDKWIGGTFVDYETNKKIVKRVYIKQNPPKEIVYIITGLTEPFNITKRISE